MDKRTLLLNPSPDIYYNLAAEHYMLYNLEGTAVSVWRGGPCVVIGANQNAYAEADIAYLRGHGIPLSRRMTGGGAVYHDPGNVNYTYITDLAPGESADIAGMCRTVSDFLQTLGVDARPTGRNDIEAGGRKISGSARCVRSVDSGGAGRERVLFHCTLLCDCDFGEMSAALTPGGAKIASKGITSVRSRVANLYELSGGRLNAETVASALRSHLGGMPGYETRPFTSEENDRILALRGSIYAREEYIYGSTPPYAYEKELRFGFGSVRVGFDAEKGRITRLRFSGDFIGKRHISGLERLFEGAGHRPGDIARVLESADPGEYMDGATREDLIKLFI